jgi:hypothetical protein
VKFIPAILTVTAAIVDDVNNSHTDSQHNPDTSDLLPDANDGVTSIVEIVTVEETEIIQIDQTSVQRLFTSEEWSYITKELE